MVPVAEEEVRNDIIVEDRALRRRYKHGSVDIKAYVPLEQQPLQQQPLPPNNVSDEHWTKLFGDSQFRKENFDCMVMDLLLNHVLHPETFHGEITGVDLTSLRFQRLIRQLISNQQIDEAINRINEAFGPTFLRDRPHINFHLEQQKFIELFRSGNDADGLKFARQFYYTWNQQKAFTKEVERTMFVMMYPNDQDPNSPVAELMLTTPRLLNLGLIVAEEIMIFLGREFYSDIPFRVGQKSIFIHAILFRRRLIESALKALKIFKDEV